MKKIILFILPVCMVACSSPKYVYHFDHYDYSSGKKPQLEKGTQDAEPVFQLQENLILADGGNSIILEDITASAVSAYHVDKTVSPDTDHSVNNISKQERREIRREIKNELGKLKRTNSDVGLNEHNAEAMDKDLKLAIIFGAVGLTLSLFSGINAAFWVLGVIAIVVGVVFLVRWLLRQ